MTGALGIVLVVLLLGLLAVALRTAIASPFRALGILVAGMAVHNFLLMILLRLGTPDLLVRLIQAWKEIILLALLGVALWTGSRRWQAGSRPRLRPIDGLVVAFAIVALIYFVLPGSLLQSHATLTQRVLGLRVLLLIPVLYLFGRIFPPRGRSDLTWTATLIVGAAGLVGLFGMIELWLVPTAQWLGWGVNQLSAWLGFTYHGPSGLPENFFQTTAEGILLRRMVSTYVSPLAIAYTGLLVVPLGIALLLDRHPRLRSFAAVALGLALLGILFSVTRLALAALVAEWALLYVLWRRRWLIPATLLVAGAVVLVIYQYPRIGPLVDRNLVAIGHRPTGMHFASQSDPSAIEHLQELGKDVDFVRQHPLGAGLGSSVHRYGATVGTGESAVLDVFGELGVVGGLLYIGIYLAGIVYGLRAFFRRRDDPLASALGLTAAAGGLALIPITLTSDIWSDFSVTFLFWWAVGYSVMLATTATTATTTLGRGRGPVTRFDGFTEPDSLVV
ncbi:MAG: hypothetical protein E6I37_07620 [Chloroflexi bacterium]|nr:MAG: hypothetical protein E6I37_07620 [Chloroflexota bacterium]